MNHSITHRSVTSSVSFTGSTFFSVGPNVAIAADPTIKGISIAVAEGTADDGEPGLAISSGIAHTTVVNDDNAKIK